MWLPLEHWSTGTLTYACSTNTHTQTHTHEQSHTNTQCRANRWYSVFTNAIFFNQNLHTRIPMRTHTRAIFSCITRTIWINGAHDSMRYEFVLRTSLVTRLFTRRSPTPRYGWTTGTSLRYNRVNRWAVENLQHSHFGRPPMCRTPPHQRERGRER